MASTRALVACLISVAGGVGNGIQWVAVMTVVQEVTEQDYQARVIGLLESAGAAMPGIGFVLGGVVTAALGPRQAYAVAGAGVLVVLVGAALALRTRARRQRQRRPGVEPSVYRLDNACNRRGPGTPHVGGLTPAAGHRAGPPV